jgi:hypothetical protein
MMPQKPHRILEKVSPKNIKIQAHKPGKFIDGESDYFEELNDIDGKSKCRFEGIAMLGFGIWWSPCFLNPGFASFGARYKWRPASTPTDTVKAR